MKILLFSDACYNDNIFPLYKALIEKGHEVVCLIHLSPLRISLFDIEKRLPRQSIIKVSEYTEIQKYSKYVNLDKMYFVNHELSSKKPWNYLLSALDVYFFVKKGKFDYIYTDKVYSRFNNILFRFKERTIFIQHDTFPHTGEAASKHYLKCLKRMHKKIAKVVILNKHDYIKFCSTYNLNPSKVFVNKLGPLECIKLFTSPDVTEEKNNILFFGRISEYKGIEYLCEAMTNVHEVIPDAKLTIAGSGKLYFDFSKYSKLSYIQLVNRYITEEELACLVQKCCVSVFPYTDSTQSGGVLTSFALGKPVIVSDLETMRELVIEGRHGLMAKPRNAKSLAETIIKFLTDIDIQNQMKENIVHDYFSGERSWAFIADQYVDIFNSSLK